MYFLFGQNRSK